MNSSYLHTEIPEITSDFLNDGDVVVGEYGQPTISEMMDIALMTFRIAIRLGMQEPKAYSKSNLPYDSANDQLVFNSPMISALTGKRIHFLRGWKQFDSCVKGFNSLGLMASQVILEMTRLSNLPFDSMVQEKKSFLLSRTQNGRLVFTEQDITPLIVEELLELPLLDLALWNCFSKRTIVCSTSSNMGISLHQALRFMQGCRTKLLGKEFTLLNSNEGRLIIWCPDPGADFMNPEKTKILNELQNETPALTKLQTYINRQQRDPGALKDAFKCGGYFFPTNPQSIDEVQNLIFVALNMLAEEQHQRISELLENNLVLQTLSSLGCKIEEGKVYVNHGIEGGIGGLTLPYLIMLEEIITIPKIRAISTWNQASIGAALAAAILADRAIRQPNRLSEQTRAELNSAFPNISKFVDNKKLGRDLDTRIHGVFDLANLQSLAQLLGVVVEKHLSGRGTAYVGLGSSSYSNGNRCYEILKDSFENNGPFKGKTSFHPATHAINPFAQALIYAEDFLRMVVAVPEFFNKAKSDKILNVKRHVKKPEPAGAASLAGYLLSRLDAGTLSVLEIAYYLKLAGFSKYLFLEFCQLNANEHTLNKLVQEASEEGNYMGELTKNILLLLDWPLRDLEEKYKSERLHSQLNDRLNSLDNPWFEQLNPLINIYLTGDNTRQPEEEWIDQLIKNAEENSQQIIKCLDQHSEIHKNHQPDLISWMTRFFTGLSSGIRSIDKTVNNTMNRSLKYLVNRQVSKLTQKKR